MRPDNPWVIIGICLVAATLFVGWLYLIAGNRRRTAPDLGYQRRTTSAEGLERRQAAVERPSAQSPGAPAPRAWWHELRNALHALVIGQSRAGKTVLTHYAATQRAQNGETVYVFDPDARPGMWPGCTTLGGGDDYTAIERGLETIRELIVERRRERAAGARRFPRVTVVLSEAADILRECGQLARPLLEDVLRRGGKLNVSLLMDVQDRQVKTLDLEGASKLLDNFSIVLEVRKTPEGQRLVRIDGVDYPVPRLVDPEELADEYARQHPPVPQLQEEPANLIAKGETPEEEVCATAQQSPVAAEDDDLDPLRKMTAYEVLARLLAADVLKGETAPLKALGVPPGSASKPYAVAKQKLDEARQSIQKNNEPGL